MPVPRPDAGCIWTSFQSSGKRHLLLTGGRGSGKTTLLNALAARLAEGYLPGVTTWAEPGRAVYLRDNGSGASAAVGVFDPGRPGPENRMRPVEEAFRTFGTEALARAGAAAGEWASVDEVGYLETTCPAYCAALLALMERKRLLAAVRKQDLSFLQALCQRPDVFCVDLDAPYGRLGCVIMASGLGRRFGGGKLLARLHGKPLLQYALDATGGLFARRVVVTRDPAAAALCRAQGVETVLHGLPSRSDTVRLGLAALTAPGEPPLAGCLFCPADQPLLRRETVASLALGAACAPGPIWRPAWQGQPGAPVLFPAWTFAELASLPEGQGGGAVVRRWPGRVRCIPAACPAELQDVDRREDLAQLERLMNKYYT